MNDLSIFLLTSTKGHFGVHDRYKQTVESLFSIYPEAKFSYKIANINIDKENEKYLPKMEYYLREFGFNIVKTNIEWSHGNESHQLAYLESIRNIIYSCQSPNNIGLFLEDDFRFKLYNDRFDFGGLYEIVEKSLLYPNSDTMQVRIPRWSNEPERILKLKEKHGIDGKIHKFGNLYQCNDWSNNPYFFRISDLKSAINLVFNTNLPRHSEHGLGSAMKLMSGSRLPFIFFSPELIRCGHVGTLLGEEDNLNEPLIAN